MAWTVGINALQKVGGNYEASTARTYITLRYIKLHYIPFRSVPFLCIALHSITLQVHCIYIYIYIIQTVHILMQLDKQINVRIETWIDMLHFLDTGAPRRPQDALIPLKELPSKFLEEDGEVALPGIITAEDSRVFRARTMPEKELKTQCCWVICQFQTLLKQVIPLISLKIV